MRSHVQGGQGGSGRGPSSEVLYLWGGVGVCLSSEVLCSGEGGLYSEGQCIIGCSHMGPRFPSCGQTDMTENIIFRQLHWWAVIIHFAKINEDLSFEMAVLW